MVAPITVKIDGEVDPLKKALGQASKSVKLFGHDMEVSLPTSKLDIAVEGVKLLAKGTKAVAGAAKDAAAEEKIFAEAMTAAGAAQGNWVAQTDDAIAASQRLAFTDTETRKAITSLATATGDTEQALQLLTVAQDVARLSGSSLEAAADAVAKAQAGQDTTLKRMLPGLEAGATAQETIANASNLAAGAADNYAQSSQVMGEKVKIAFGEIAETVGQSLGPSLKQLGAALKPLIVAFGELATVVLPPLLRMLERVINIGAKVANVITKIVQAVTKLISKIRELLGPLTEAVNKLGQIDLNPFNKAAAAGSQTVAAAGQFATTTTPAAAGRSGGGVTINIYGDPAVIEAKVTKALRDYSRRNGAATIFAPSR